MRIPQIFGGPASNLKYCYESSEAACKIPRVASSIPLLFLALNF